jgi:triosephosphate isomerase (TIM)
MKLRKKIVAGNWKMNCSIADAQALATEVARELADHREVEVVLCPPFTALKVVGDAIAQGQVKLGAQNMHWEKSGAFTGEVSAAMLRDLYCRYVIVGHSERRQFFGETDSIVNRKARMALESSLDAIVCVGETLEQRDGGQYEAVIQAQLEGSLQGLEGELAHIVVAYEPVWAIGTGRTATPTQAQDVHAFMRQVVAGLAGREAADGLRIQYGGSVKPGNARELMAQPDIDGALVGGAALDARSFVEIVLAASPH